MGLKPLGSWAPWQVALLALGWMAGVLGYVALRTALAPMPAGLGPDDFYIVAHVHYVRLVVLGPPVLLTAVWLWRRHLTRARQPTVAAADERGH